MTDQLSTRFVSQAKAILGVRLLIVLLCVFFFHSYWFLIALVYTLAAHQLAEHIKFGRWAFFITLNLDLVWIAFGILNSGGLTSPLMPITLITTFLFALLFPNPIVLLSPLSILPIATSVSSQGNLYLLTLYAALSGVIVYLTNFSLSHEEQQNEKILNLERQLKKLAVIEERNRLSREIHDGLGGTLSGLIIQSEYLLTLPSITPQIKYEIEELKSTAEGAMDELRRTLAMTQNEFELAPQLQQYCHTISTRHHIPIDIRIEGEAPSLSNEQQLNIFRILQESLTNVVKHAHAKNVMVQINFTASHMTLQIRDDGVGFDVRHTPKHHYGLINLYERARKMGGDVEINSKEGEGTVVCFKQAFALARGL